MKQHHAAAGIHSIYQFALEVPDLVEEAKFLKVFGLDVDVSSDQLALHTGGPHVWARIFKGPRKRLAYITLGCYEADFATIKAQTLAAGAVPAAPYEGGPGGGIWFTDPDGNLIQLLVADKTQPDAKSKMADMNVPANLRGAPARSAVPQVRPTRLSHMALFSSDVSRAVKFYEAALGLQLADRSGEIIAFTYGRHGSDHHLLAFAKGSHGGGLHHPSWDVPSIEAVGRVNTQLRAAGYTAHWGPGRHVLGSNYFNYARDAYGQWWEASAHIDYIEKDAAWETADYAAEDALYLWGPDLPAGVMDNPEPIREDALASID